MSEQITVEFWGGPADGTVLVFDGWTPPPLYAVLTMPDSPRLWSRSDSLDPIGPGTFCYRRESSDLDHGPLWLYVPDDREVTPR